MRPTQLLKPLCILCIIATLCWIAAHRYDEGRFTALAALSVIAWGGLFHASGHLDNHVRRRALLAALPRLGLQPDDSLPDDLQHRAAELHFNPRDTDFRIHLFADGSLAGPSPTHSNPQPARIAEYTLRLRAGNSTHTLTFLEAALACPPDWPDFQLVKPLFRPIRIYAPHPSAAAAFLTPTLRAWLALTTDNDTWTAKDGFLSITRAKACNPRDAAQLLARLSEFSSRVAAQTPIPTTSAPRAAA